MNNSGKIFAGLAIFLLLITLPLWYSAAFGGATEKPDLKIVCDAKECVAPTAYMTAYHMDLLNEWRDEVVRDRDRLYTAENGKTFDKSLSRTCINCHYNKADFCDQCHDYAGVKPYCWDCHVEPKETP